MIILKLHSTAGDFPLERPIHILAVTRSSMTFHFAQKCHPRVTGLSVSDLQHSAWRTRGELIVHKN